MSEGALFGFGAAGAFVSYILAFLLPELLSYLDLSASAPTFVQEYPSLFLRDPSGNFLEIAC